MAPLSVLYDTDEELVSPAERRNRAMSVIKLPALSLQGNTSASLSPTGSDKQSPVAFTYTERPKTVAREMTATHHSIPDMLAPSSPLSPMLKSSLSPISARRFSLLMETPHVRNTSTISGNGFSDLRSEKRSGDAANDLRVAVERACISAAKRFERSPGPAAYHPRYISILIYFSVLKRIVILSSMY